MPEDHLPIKGANVELTVAENDELLKKGHLVIDDPERGHIEIWIMFDENRPGIVGKKGKIKVHRAGTAARVAND